jgi:hypothetical protein
MLWVSRGVLFGFTISRLKLSVSKELVDWKYDYNGTYNANAFLSCTLYTVFYAILYILYMQLCLHGYTVCFIELSSSD